MSKMREIIIILVYIQVLLDVRSAAAFSDDVPDSKSLVFQSHETFINTTSTIHHMELDLFLNDDSILFSDGNSLKTVTKDKRTSVVASGFGTIRGFKQMNSTRVAVSDQSNHCVKIVNREDGSVRVLAGQCGKYGYSDGIPGLFHHPWAIEIHTRSPDKLLVLDFSNNALRSVDISSGAISTVIRSGLQEPLYMAWNKEHLLVVNYKYYISELVWNKDNTVTNTLLAGSTSSGYVDGDFSLARFDYPYDIESISEDVLLIADRSNNRLRLLDVLQRKVLPVCTNDNSLCTKSTEMDAMPHSLLKTADAVYIGYDGRISKLSGGDLFTTTPSPLPPTTTPSPPTTATEPACLEQNITRRVEDGQTFATVDIGDGQVLKMEPGRHWYLKDNCSLSILVEGITSRSTATPTTTPTTTPAPECNTRNITVTLQEGESRTSVEVFPGKWSKLGAGTHEYPDIASGNCTITINVERAAGVNSTCPANITAVASNITGIVFIDWPVKGSGYELKLPIGRFPYRVPYGDVICDVFINVVNPNLRQRFVFEAVYDVSCKREMFGISENLISATARQHFVEIKEICGKFCSPVASNQPVIDCSNGKLTVRWPTNLVYGGDVDIHKVKMEAMPVFKQRISLLSASSLALVVLTKMPPVVYPVRNSDGEPLTFTHISYCIDKSTYNPQTDRCQ